MRLPNETIVNLPKHGRWRMSYPAVVAIWQLPLPTYQKAFYARFILLNFKGNINCFRKTTLLQHCYQIGGIKRRDSKASVERVLPEYSCLLLSPANLWQQSLQTFSLDATIVSTIYNYQVGIGLAIVMLKLFYSSTEQTAKSKGQRSAMTT